MPRIYRVRVHNIHFEAGGQPRIYHDTIFEPFGENTLLLLGNGGGKTLLLHLIAQVVEPNAPLQGRRIKRLVEKEKFTGHVLVEWLLDGAASRFLLTGFCFADYIGGGHAGMNYFTYLHSYDAQNAYDLISLPLADEMNRTFNIKQLRDNLRGSPVKVYPEYRKQDYQRQLKSYQIDPQEWRHILKINDSEGGIENFFEGCSKTRTLLDKLLVPMIDEVLERREERDPLREAFRGTAREVMDLPQLKVQSEALESLSHQLPSLAGGFGRVEQAALHYYRLLERRATLLKTIALGLPRLEERREKLIRRLAAKKVEREDAAMVLEALEVEEKRREWALADEKSAGQGKLVEAARQRWEASQKRYTLYKAFKKWAAILREKENLTKWMQGLQLHEQKEAAFRKELDLLRKETLPLLQRAISAAAHWERVHRQQLDRQQAKQEELSGEKTEAGAELEKTGRGLLRLQVLQEQFQEERQRVSQKMAALKVSFDAGQPRSELERIRLELKKTGEEKEKAEKKLEQAETYFVEAREQRAKLAAGEERLAKEREQLQQQFAQWREQLLFLAGELKLAGCPHHPGEDGAAALVWLSQKEEQVLAELGEFRQRRYRWLEQEQLWGEGRAPRPHAEIDLVVKELDRLKVAAQPAVDLLENYSEEERQQMLAERPWLPYALLVEPVQLEDLRRRRLQLRTELSVPVPLVARTDFHEGAIPAELYFLSHRGLERFYSGEKIEQYRRKIADGLETIAEQLKTLQDENGKIRDLGGRLASFRRGFPYPGEAGWQEALRLVEERWVDWQAALEKMRRRVEQALEDKEARRRDLQRLHEDSHRLQGARDIMQDYFHHWTENEARSGETSRLKRQQAKQAQQLKELQRALNELKSNLEEIAGKLKSEQHRFEHYQEAWRGYFQEMGPETPVEQPAAKEVLLLAGEQRAQLDRSLDELKAKVEVLDKGYGGDYRLLREQIKEARARVDKWKEEICELDLAPDDVQEKFFPVDRNDLQLAGQAAQKDHQKLDEEAGLWQKKKEEAASARGAYQERFSQLKDRYPQAKLPDLKKEDLALEKERRQKMNSELDGLIRQFDAKIVLTGKQVEDYQRAAEDLKQMDVEIDKATVPLPQEQEQEQLLGRAGEEVAKSRREEKEMIARLDEAKQLAAEQLQVCRGELNKLHGDELKQFFVMLGKQIEAPSWEQRVAELQGYLRQVEEAIAHFKDQVKKRLDGLSAKVEEMVRRTWRHVDGVLEQVRELQRRSRVPLRGETHPLFKIGFMRPDEEEGAARLHKYLEDVIAAGVKMQKQGKEEALIDDFLREAIETVRLLDQVVPLEGIEIRLLKPRDSSSYQAGQYDRWDDLHEWSQGQRFAGRFAFFVVLLSYIRHCRSGGLVTAAVILADNPFGQASSSHILEIVDAVTRQQNVQLFSCTALRNTEIMREFPVIYSLVPVLTMSGKERMRLEQKRQSKGLHYLEQAHARIPMPSPSEPSQLKLF